jgi:hypothetical protein
MSKSGDLKELADCVSRDIGKPFLPGDCYGMMLFGPDYDGLKRFNTEEVADIWATFIKETSEWRSEDVKRR